MFQKIKDTDPEIQLFISDIPEEFRMFIWVVEFYERRPIKNWNMISFTISES